MNVSHRTKKADMAEYPYGNGHVGLFTDEPPDRRVALHLIVRISRHCTFCSRERQGDDTCDRAEANDGTYLVNKAHPIDRRLLID